MTLVDVQQETVGRAPEVDAGSTTGTARRVVRWLARRPELPWAAVAALAVWLLVQAGNPLSDPVVYGLYWAVAIAVPGMLLQRALVGSRSLPEDLGFGSVLGIAWQLIGWFTFTALQLQALLWTWPLAVILVFALVPTLRKHWRASGRVPLAWSWASSAGMSVALVVIYLTWLRDTELPPHTRLLEPDLWYHLSINHELTRTVFPNLPYIVGEPLQYHWFANAHMASGQMMTGLDAPSILLHLWLIPIVLTLFLVTCGLSRWLTGLWWPAVLAATFTVSLPLAISITAAQVGGGLSPIVYASCSSILAGVVMVALASSILRLLKEPAMAGSWCLLALLTLLAAGTKPTVLPLALAGMAIATGYLLVQRRSARRATWILAVLGGGLVMGALAVMGGTTGSEVRLFGYFRLVKGFRTATGDDSVQGVTGGWLVPGVADSGWSGWALAFALLAALVLFHLPSLLGVAGVLLRRTKDDAAVWWLAAVNIAAFGPLMVIDHMGGSQKYFIVTVFPLGMVLTLHMLAAYLPERRGFGFRWAVIGVALAGAIVASCSAGVFADEKWHTIGAGVVSLLIPVGAFVVMALVVLALVRAFVRSSRRTGYGVVLVMSLLLGWSVPHALGMTLGQGIIDSDDAPLSVKTAGPRLEAPKQRAAEWLASHSGTDDVVVTNAHCFKFSRAGRCDARGFWISALSGRRVLLEGWVYTPENALTRTLPNLTYELQPSPWPRKLSQSNAAVSAPTRQLLDRLSDRHKVRWIFADKTVHRPARALNDLATLRYENRDVAIFELRQEAEDS